jgi:uroporphyrin-III C-methyltransferase / precorrin-2 dehydrogenase / sirohydrochlorin ferrochelatase
VSTNRTPSDAPKGRMAPLARLPLFFALHGKRAVVAGGTAAAAWKAELLSAAGACVDVYAERYGEEMNALTLDPPRGSVVLHARKWQRQDFAGAAIAIGACEDEASAAEFAQASRASGVPVNVVDRPAFCDFSFGAIVNRSPLVVGVSTDGAAPVFAQAVRAKIEALLPQGFALWTQAAQSWRRKLRDLSAAARRRFWQRFVDHAVAHANTAPAQADFDRLLASAKRDGKNDLGSVALVGAGPGDAELLTLRALRALQTADVILFDDLVSDAVLDFARREARKMLVGKTGFGPSCKQDATNALMVSLARQGKRVVRLKGGDPLIFGRAAEEIEACAVAGIAVEIVPGITAAQGASASLGVPLTGRGQARRVQYITGHARDGHLPDDIDWRALADPSCTTAVYMPKRTLAALSDRAISAGLAPATPALAIARATRPDQQTVGGTIVDIAQRVEEAALPGPVLVMIGSVLDGADIGVLDTAEITKAARSG